jgi:hypothetical protein
MGGGSREGREETRGPAGGEKRTTRQRQNSGGHGRFGNALPMCRVFPAHATTRLRWSDRGDIPSGSSSGSPFPLPTRLADGLGARKSPWPRLRVAVRPVRRARGRDGNVGPPCCRRGSGGSLGVRIQRTESDHAAAGTADKFPGYVDLVTNACCSGWSLSLALWWTLGAIRKNRRPLSRTRNQGLRRNRFRDESRG